MIGQKLTDEGEQIKEVYARFGLAVYYAQVLEHGLVNALLLLDFISTRQGVACSREDWSADVDAFMDRHFEGTMGKLMKQLRKVTQVDLDTEDLLTAALKKRNWLVHDYFRERATDFLCPTGREQMLCEIDECRFVIEAADHCLELIVAPVRTKAGITDAALEQAYQRMLDGVDREV